LCATRNPSHEPHVLFRAIPLGMKYRANEREIPVTICQQAAVRLHQITIGESSKEELSLAPSYSLLKRFS
jgi:hypothetical protein